MAVESKAQLEPGTEACLSERSSLESQDLVNDIVTRTPSCPTRNFLRGWLESKLYVQVALYLEVVQKARTSCSVVLYLQKTKLLSDLNAYPSLPLTLLSFVDSTAF